MNWIEDKSLSSTSLFHPLDACQLLNLHSCEEKWLEFVATPSNEVMSYEEEILGYLRAMQYSLTEESLTHAAGSCLCSLKNIILAKAC